MLLSLSFQPIYCSAKYIMLTRSSRPAADDEAKAPYAPALKEPPLQMGAADSSMHTRGVCV